MAKAKTKSKAQPKSEADIGRALFGGPEVDLDIFASEVTPYKVTDVKGELCHFEIPDDSPFELVQGFLIRWDAWWNSQADLFNKQNAKSINEKTIERANKATKAAWHALIEALGDLAAIRQPEVTGDELSKRFGANVLQQWAGVARVRFMQSRSGLSVDDYIAAVFAEMTGGDSKKKTEKPKSSPPSSKSSDD